jgi:hypothetical protein
MADLLLATEGGQVVQFNTGTKAHSVIFQCSDDEAMMGIARHEDHLYVASLSRMYKLRADDHSLVKQTEFYSPSPDFHQHQWYDGLLYTTITKRNQIWVYNEELEIVRVHDIEPPMPEKKVRYQKNYNHINNIIRHEGKFYVNLNWLTKVQYAASGVAVFDEDFRLIEKFEYGWETHDFQFIDGKRMAICATSSKRKKIHHPRISGIMLEGELVFEHDSEESFCKGLTYDKDFLYLCGGRKQPRAKRKNSNAVIYVLNRKDFSLAEQFESEEIKAVKGVIVAE